MKKSMVIINGKKIRFSGNAVINIKRDIDNNKKMDIDDNTRMVIEINGNIGDLSCDDCNIKVNGNTGKINLQNGKVVCDKVYGGVNALSLNVDKIKGDVNTIGNIMVNKLIGNANNKTVFTNFESVTNIKELKSGMIVYHRTYGRGKISYLYDTIYTKSISVKFDSEEYVKSLTMGTLISNKSLSVMNPMKNIIENDI